MNVLERLINEDPVHWDTLISEYERRNRSLKVPIENTPTTLHRFNVEVNELYTEICHDYGRARRNRDAIQRLIKNVLEDYYKGPNEQARKAAGIQFAQMYPAPDAYPEPTINLFDLEDRFLGYYYALDSMIKSLQAKSDAKITSNSILNYEKSIMPN